MPLNERQQFLQKNFNFHGRLIADVLTKHNGLPTDEAELRDLLYKTIMTFLDTAFAYEKIIVKSNKEWDLEESTFNNKLNQHNN